MDLIEPDNLRHEVCARLKRVEPPPHRHAGLLENILRIVAIAKQRR